MRMKHAATVLVATVLVTCLFSRPSFAQLVELPDPFGDASSEAVIGFYPHLGVNAVFFRDLATGACNGWTMTLPEADYIILGEGGDDFIGVANGSFRFCGVTVQSIMGLSGAVDIAGGPGNDRLDSSFTSFLFGGPGNDVLEASFAGAILAGEGGNDSILLNAVADGAEMYGDGSFSSGDPGPAGNDCMLSRGGTFRVLDCGPGEDQYSGTEPRPPSCEQPAVSCCEGLLC